MSGERAAVSPAAARAKAAARWWGGVLENSDVDKVAFVAKLAELILAEMEREKGDARVKTDYDPDDKLTEALATAGARIPAVACNTCRDLGLPYKTCMNVWDDGTIEVSVGRGAPFVEVAQ